MIRILRANLLLIVLLIFSTCLFAQAKKNTCSYTLKRNNDHIEMSISSKTPLQMGNNAFFLYIDAQQFNQYQQSRQGKRDILIYAIPQGIYQDLKMGAAIWLTYGELFEATSSNDERTQLLNQNPRNCWSLGALNTKKIKK